MDRAAQITQLLKEASKCGISDSSAVREVIEDYFCLPTSELDSDVEVSDSGTDSDDELVLNPLSTTTSVDRASPVASTSTVEEVDVDDDDLEETAADDAHREEEGAMDRAANMFECINMPQKKCHCVCKLYNGQPCISQFSNENQESIRLNTQELSAYEKDLLLLGIICASINASKETLSMKKLKVGRKATRIRYFYYEHRRICRDTFLFLMDISKDKLTNLKKWYLANGIYPRKKKSGGRRKTALSFDEIKRVSRFIINFAEQHSIILPGRIPGFKRDDVKVLPSCETKASVWRYYKAASMQGERIVRYSTFRKLWNQLLPYIIICKPMSDLCWTCQLNNTRIIRQVNVSENEKSAALRLQEAHLEHARAERAHYQDLCQQSRQVADTHNLQELHVTRPLSRNIAFHYSFDFAQQVHFPSDPLQPGPIYFKTPRKCQIFGIHADGASKQVNYLVDECVSCGKGANVVISYLHHFLDNYSAGECHLQLNADNCVGQNKNNFMLWYLAWRVATGLNATATISFLPAGHTKFSPDWCFGLIKRVYRRTKVSCMQDIVNVIHKSSEKALNLPQLVGDEDGKVIVPTYDWKAFLTPAYKKVVGLKKNHHFHISDADSGKLLTKEYTECENDEHSILCGAVPQGMPTIVRPAGLDKKRQAYLFKEIREFCTDETKDIVCPCPLEDVDSSSSDEDNEPLVKRSKSNC